MGVPSAMSLSEVNASLGRGYVISQSASSSQLTVISLVKPRLNLAGGCQLQLAYHHC